MILSCGSGVKVVHRLTARVTWHLDEVSVDRLTLSPRVHKATPSSIPVSGPINSERSI